MVAREVLTQTYAVFEAHSLKDIMPAYDRILKEWLPSSGYQPGDGPDFELYPPAWENETSRSFICYPVKKK